MGSKKFVIHTSLFVILICVSSWLFIWSLYQDYLLFTRIVLLSIVVFLCFLMIRYVNIHRRKWDTFLDIIIKSQEYDGLDMPSTSKNPDTNLKMNKVLERINEVKVKKHSQKELFNSIIENIESGVLAFTDDGTALLYNPCFLKLFNLTRIKNISDLDKLKAGFSASLLRLPAGSNMIQNIEIKNGEVSCLDINSKHIIVDGKKIILLSFQNASKAIEASEVNTWDKLIRILSHEIMNSVSPIRSLSNIMIKNLNDKMDDKGFFCLENSEIQDLKESLEAINRRNEGLIHFVKAYRSLASIPKPDFKHVAISDMINAVLKLKYEALTNANIKLNKQYPENKLFVFADESLISQVIINLLNNAITALEDKQSPYISLSVFQEDNNAIGLSICDNGKGMSSGIKEKIFLPFFTTKDHGNGIGLSMCRQIMKLHKGSIRVKSGPQQGACFTISFPPPAYINPMESKRE